MPSQFRLASAERPVPAPPAVPGPATYTWFGCDLVTGVIVEELPFVASGPLQSVIGAYTSLSGSIAIPDAPANWERATDPYRTMLVCVRDSDLVPLWAGIVISRTGGSANTVELGLATLESYFDRRYMYSATYTQTRISQVAVNVFFFGADEDGIGLNYGVPTIVAPLVDRTYSSDSDQTVYAALSELMNSTGIEWTIVIEWADATKSAFKKTFSARPRIGTESDTPRAVFDMPGCVSSYTFSEDYTSSKGANHITMFGDGEGDTRPTSGPQIAQPLIDAGWPRVEYRATRSGVTQPSTLIEHAQEMLAWKASGAQIFTVTADASAGPLLGVDWSLGDDIALVVAWSPRHPSGLAIRARAVGWELDLSGSGSVTPLLQEDGDE